MNHTYDEVPDSNISNRLISLFNLGRYTELENLVHTITHKYPNYGDAWKLLGTALFITGRYEDALAPMRKAEALLSNDANTHIILASVFHSLGRFTEAEICLHRAIQIDPCNAVSYNDLGVVQNNLLKFTEAEISYRNALTMKSDFPEAYNNLGNTIRNLDRKAEAVDCYRKAIDIKPDYFDAYDNLGTTLMSLGCATEAEACYRQAIEIRPDYSDAHNNLGVVFKSLNRLDEAEASYRKAIEIEPDFAEAHNNLGITLKELARLGEAEASYRRALVINPDYVDAYNNLGIVQKILGRLDEAEACYRRALAIKPNSIETSTNLAALLNGQGKFSMGLTVIWPLLQTNESIEAKCLFVDCIKHIDLMCTGDDIRAAITQALIEPWERPRDLALVSTSVVMNTSTISECITRADEAWPQSLSEQDLYGEAILAKLADDVLLCALLTSTPICDIRMERFLTVARRAMLERISKKTLSDAEPIEILRFYSVLSQQCFINEYVFFQTEDEIKKADLLRDKLIAALDTNHQIPDYLPIAVAAYFPLYLLPDPARLYVIKTDWSDAVLAVLDQQVREPGEELLLRSSIAKLTEIEDATSILVQNQYEENPYPRWIKAEPAGKSMSVSEYLRRRFPLASFQRTVKSDSANILIAGCGTGQHPIGTAQKFRESNVLAIDLSKSSLCYAKRKTRELGLTNVFYAQADLLKLGSLGSHFDVIESCGVLHHLANPLYGWKILLSLLCPGGFMNLGFYSKLARRNIVRIRDVIAQYGYGATADEIRKCRQELVDSYRSEEFSKIFRSIDFFSISACRDLLFHVQEHLMTLTEIEIFISENNLIFLGFEIDSNTLNAYKRRFPGDPSATNLSQWQIFESEYPDSFCGMYQFWVQKV
ncbi:MAG: tetratricopeptide repeat protein [Desulfuromonadaceae bacterium]|nr:tetratricopeptide repeat protein [Desulfuromonadaceae bacterium]